MKVEELPWERLSEKARAGVADLVVMLASGFTGDVTLRCQDGGIQRWDERGGRTSKELGNRYTEWTSRNGNLTGTEGGP